MDIDRCKVVEYFLENLFRISDKEYQKRIWIEGSGSECHDFDEAVNEFFSDADPILENYQDYKLSEMQYELLKKFRDQFRAFSDKNDYPEEFIDTPEWEKITEMAKEVLKAFNYTKHREQ